MAIETARDFDDPSVLQVLVFLRNRIGELRELLRVVESTGARIFALAITDSADFAIVRIVVDRFEAVRLALVAEGVAVSESRVLAVVLPEAGGLLAVCRVLIQAEINIHYAYPMFGGLHDRPAAILHADNLHLAAEALRHGGVTLLDDSDLGCRGG
jgi:hypothetical protein